MIMAIPTLEKLSGLFRKQDKKISFSGSNLFQSSKLWKSSLANLRIRIKKSFQVLKTWKD